MKRIILVSIFSAILTMFCSLSWADATTSTHKKKTSPPIKVLQQQDSEQPVTPPDTDSCGLGWKVTQKKTLSATTTRATTNVSVPPTFGMTTGTMGCAQHPLAERHIEAARYAFNNFDILTIEMAEGRGEFLASFARTMGCDDLATDAFSRMTQNRYRILTRDGRASALEFFDRVMSVVKTNPVLVAHCGTI